MKCKRCGTCCRKSPPALHLPDIPLYKEGHLHKGDLLTLRKGELVRDNVRGKLISLSEELVRIKARKDGSCPFLDLEDNLCLQYEFRPLECRILTCWDPQPLIATYEQDRVSRLDLVPRESALAHIIQVHEERCAVGKLSTLVHELRNSQSASPKAFLTELADLVITDFELRDLLKKKAGAGQAELEFVFGRPLPTLLKSMGVVCSRHGDKLVFSLDQDIIP